MEIRIKFYGGPLDKMEAATNSLDEIKLFFDDRNRRVHCYRRIDETAWVFDETRSRKLSDIYDAAKAKLQSKPSRVRFSDDPVPLPDDQVPVVGTDKPATAEPPAGESEKDTYWWNDGKKPEDLL